MNLYDAEFHYCFALQLCLIWNIFCFWVLSKRHPIVFCNLKILFCIHKSASTIEWESFGKAMIKRCVVSQQTDSS
jgi:hypothetical protein